MVYFFTAKGGYDGSVMVTASHNPPGDNGLKVSMRTALPVGYANGLNEVERLAAADAGTQQTGEGAAPCASCRAAADPDALARYVEWQKAATDGASFSALRYAVDCSNGMASLLVRELFPGAVVVNDVLDGTFPAHSPNPLKAEARAQVAALVREKGLDCGVIFDGDADRAMFVDERGEFVQPDYLIPLVARATLAAQGAASPGRPLVLHDVRTSRGAIEALREMGFEPSMVQVGHAFAKPAMRERGALCGGELAGHYYFSEFFGCDSGVLAARRILSEVAAAKARGETLSQMMFPITSRYDNSGEMNFKVDEKDLAIARVLETAKSFGEETGRSEIDGVRLEFADGWINVRKSNTEPYLRLIVERRGDAGPWVEALKAAVDAR
jgi:phosphomannomutase